MRRLPQPDAEHRVGPGERDHAEAEPGEHVHGLVAKHARDPPGEEERHRVVHQAEQRNGRNGDGIGGHAHAGPSPPDRLLERLGQGMPQSRLVQVILVALHLQAQLGDRLRLMLRGPGEQGGDPPAAVHALQERLATGRGAASIPAQHAPEPALEQGWPD